MESLKVSLCPHCTACPEVEILGDKVRIGETGNLAVLKKDEWNVLLELMALYHTRSDTRGRETMRQRNGSPGRGSDVIAL